jgi:hypothetical protein
MRNAGIQHRRLNLADGYPVTPFACHCYTLLADRATRPQAAILTARTIWSSLRRMLPGRRASYLPGGGAEPRLSRADVRPAAGIGTTALAGTSAASQMLSGPAVEPSNRQPGPDPRKTAPTAITKFQSGAADQGIGQTGRKASTGISAGQAADTRRDTSRLVRGRRSASWTDKTVKVITPATSLRNVDAGAAGATSDGRRPEPIKKVPGSSRPAGDPGTVSSAWRLTVPAYQPRQTVTDNL